MKINNNRFFLLLLIFFAFTKAHSQPFFDNQDWKEFAQNLEESNTIIAISNGNSYCSSQKIKRVIMVLFQIESNWYTQKIIFTKKMKIGVRELVSIENSKFIDSNKNLLRETIHNLKDLDNEISGPFLEIFYKNNQENINVPYVNAGGRGDINGFLGSEYEIIFKLYSLVNNNCF